jgi:hypothetical protein
MILFQSISGLTFCRGAWPSGGVTDEGTGIVVIGSVLDFCCHKAGLVVKAQSKVMRKIKIFVEEKKSALVRRSFLLLRGFDKFIWHGGDKSTQCLVYLF